MKRTIFFTIMLGLVTAYTATPQVEITIRKGANGGFQAKRLALTEFQAARGDTKAAAMADAFNRVLWDDLEYSDAVTLVNRSFYPSSRITNASDIKPEEWLRPGVEAQYIAFGTLRVNGSGLDVVAEVRDVVARTRFLGKRYSAPDTSERSIRDLAHLIADEILSEPGLGRGIARTEIAYVCDRAGNGIKEICVMGYDGYNPSPITAIGNLALTPAWSPDNKNIAFLSYREGSGLEIVGRADLRRHPFQRPPGLSMTPSWSKDGKIAFAASSRDGRSGTHIMVADEDGKNIRQLTTSDRTEVSPVWNPKTGQEIAFVSDRSPNRQGALQLYIMDAEGSNVQILGKEGGPVYNPAWSPDGLFIAFAWQKSGAGNNRDIWLLNLKTRAVSQLTNNQSDNERPTWAPDGRHLAFMSNRSGPWQVYSMLADGTKVRTLTHGGQNEGPAWSGYPR